MSHWWHWLTAHRTARVRTRDEAARRMTRVASISMPMSAEGQIRGRKMHRRRWFERPLDTVMRSDVEDASSALPPLSETYRNGSA